MTRTNYEIWNGDADLYPLSQKEEKEIDRRFGEAVDTLEIVPENNNSIEKIIFGVDSGYSSDTVLFRAKNL